MIWGRITQLSKRHGAKFIMEFAEEGTSRGHGELPGSLAGRDDSWRLEIPGELIEVLSRGHSKSCIFDVKLADEQSTSEAGSCGAAGGHCPRWRGSCRRSERRLDGVLPGGGESGQERVKLGEIVDRTRYFFAEEITWDPKAVKKFLYREYVLTLFERLIMAEPAEPFTR